MAPDAAAYQTMRVQVARLHRLTIDVRDAASADERALDLHSVLIDPARFAQEAVRAAGPRFSERGVTLAYKGPRTAPSVDADPDRLGQVLANLLDNALCHTPTGGHVTVALDTPANSVVLCVADDGTGILAGELEAIFERFHRGDDARAAGSDTGSGLGLTIARAIVHAHNGTLTAANNARGATLTVTLPAARREG